jgi:hypothetical protein
MSVCAGHRAFCGAWEELNLRLHPERKSPVDQRALPHQGEPSLAGHPILIPRGGHRPWGSYQQNARNRCANGRSPRSHRTVGVEVMCSHCVQLCALVTPENCCWPSWYALQLANPLTAIYLHIRPPTMPPHRTQWLRLRAIDWSQVRRTSEDDASAGSNAGCSDRRRRLGPG